MYAYTYCTCTHTRTVHVHVHVHVLYMYMYTYCTCTCTCTRTVHVHVHALYSKYEMLTSFLIYSLIHIYMYNIDNAVIYCITDIRPCICSVPRPYMHVHQTPWGTYPGVVGSFCEVPPCCGISTMTVGLLALLEVNLPPAVIGVSGRGYTRNLINIPFFN